MRLAILICIAVLQLAWSHGDEDHSSTTFENKDKAGVLVEKKLNHAAQHHLDPMEMKIESKIVDAKMSDFPSLHPLVVHFPIVLLISLPLLLGLWIWGSKKELLYLSILTSAGGSFGALIASTILHPHTSGLSDAMRQVLVKHDFWADSTQGSAFITLAILIILLLVKNAKQIKALKAIVLIVSIYTAIAVSITGHYGATLTHIHGVGAQGQYIEMDHDH